MPYDDFFFSSSTIFSGLFFPSLITAEMQCEDELKLLDEHQGRKQNMREKNFKFCLEKRNFEAVEVKKLHCIAIINKNLTESEYVELPAALNISEKGLEHKHMMHLQDCLQKILNIRTECQGLHGCCSEIEICELDHQLSPLFREIIALKRKAILKERECHNITIAANVAKAKNAQIVKNAPIASNATIDTNSTSTAVLNEGKKRPEKIVDDEKKKSS